MDSTTYERPQSEKAVFGRVLQQLCSRLLTWRCGFESPSASRRGIRGGMRLPPASRTGDGGHCCRCAWCLFFTTCWVLRGGQKNTRTRHATRPPGVPMVEGDAEGGGGGDLTNGPLDGRTNRVSNPRRRRAPPMAHTTRPSMPLTAFAVKQHLTLYDMFPGGGGGCEIPTDSLGLCTAPVLGGGGSILCQIPRGESAVGLSLWYSICSQLQLLLSPGNRQTLGVCERQGPQA